MAQSLGNTPISVCLVSGNWWPSLGLKVVGSTRRILPVSNCIMLLNGFGFLRRSSKAAISASISERTSAIASCSDKSLGQRFLDLIFGIKIHLRTSFPLST